MRLLALSAAASAYGAPPSPVWPSAFFVAFNESTSAPGTRMDNTGTWAYDFAHGRAAQWRANSGADRFCEGVHKDDTPCVHLNPGGGDANRYLVWPSLNACCLCCTDTFGCGVLKPDWVNAVNGTYEGETALTTPTWNGQADTWHAVGLQSNFYFQAPLGGQFAGTPLGIVQGADDFMWFEPASFVAGPQADALFVRPAACAAAQQCTGFCQIGA